MNEESQEATLEVLQPSAIQALESAQIDIQIKTAKQYPRSLEQFKKRGIAMVQMDQDTAESCIYVRPVGKGPDGKMKYAEGPSIRMAEIVTACYGNIRVASRVIEQTDRWVKCAGSCHDLETNSAGGAEVIASTVDRNGNPYSERQRALVAKANTSIAYRDAVFRIVPRAICKPLIDAANAIIHKKDQPITERLKRVQSWLAFRKIEDARVLATLGIKGWSEITPEHLTTLTGLKTGIMDEEVTIDEAFPPIKTEPKAPETTGLEKAKTSSQKTEPAKTVEKKPDESKEPPKTTAQTPPAASGAPTPPQQTTQTPNAAPAASSEQGTPSNDETKTSPPSDAKAEQDAGLAPLPPFERKARDSDEVSNVKLLAHNARLTEAEVMNWARKGNLAKENQKSLSELAGGKLLSLAKAWQNNPKEFAEKIKAANA